MKRILVAALAILLPGCSSPRRTDPMVRELYKDAARREVRNPVVVIHGILGARLQQRSTGQTVWGAFNGDCIDPGSPEGARALALPLVAPTDAFAYDPATADVHASGPLERIELGLVFTTTSVQVYANILRSLGAGGYADRVLFDPDSPSYADGHYTCNTFFYDWRRDNVENAIRLGRHLDELRLEIDGSAARRAEALRKEGKAEAAKEIDDWRRSNWRFDVVAHSMGGLIARYYLRYGATDLPKDGTAPVVTWKGAENVDRLVAVGTPSLGSMESFQTLCEGFTPSLFLPHFDRALLGTMPALYQLMPRNGQGLVLDGDGRRRDDIDLFDPRTWRDHGLGLADPRSEEVLAWLLPDVEDPAERRARALAYQAWCLARARAFHQSLDQDAPPCPAEIRLFAADTLPTPSRVRMVANDNRLVPTFGEADCFAPGDGTVARYSALADRAFGHTEGQWLDSPVQWTSATFLPDDHIGLTRNPVFTDNLLFHLLQQKPRKRAAAK